MTRLQNDTLTDRTLWSARLPAAPATGAMTVPGLAPIDPPDGVAVDEFAALTHLAASLHGADCQILVRLIRRVAEIEALFGEEVALAMLENAVVQADPDSRML